MFDLEKLSKVRFAMTHVPEVGGQPGTYEEKWSQWFLERSFFRDFVYRNPRGRKKGQELADAVVLFDDVVLMVQVKAQCGKHDSLAWAAEKLAEAFKQLKNTHEALVGAHIKKLKNDFYGEIAFDPADYPNRIGVIVLAHDSDRYVEANLVPDIHSAGFPVHVFSLEDFAMVTSRFDTAGDMITFLEMRGDVPVRGLFTVQEEESNIEKMLPHVEPVLRKYMSHTAKDILEKTINAFKRVASGKLTEDPNWHYGLSIDDMIARVHNVDPNLSWNKGQPASGAMRVAQFLGWLTRERRIALGRRVVDMCNAARDGKVHYFPHVQKSRGTACVYLACSLSRQERIRTLEFLVSYAHMKYQVSRCLGVATEPIGAGRSYDFIMTRQPPSEAVLEHLRTIEDPFSADIALF